MSIPAPDPARAQRWLLATGLFACLVSAGISAWLYLNPSIVTLASPFARDGGQAWIANLPPGQMGKPGAPSATREMLYENGQAIGIATAPSQLPFLRDSGGGRFARSGTWLAFSTSDGSDPNANGRGYEFALARSVAQIRLPLLIGIGTYAAAFLVSAYLRRRLWPVLAAGAAGAGGALCARFTDHALLWLSLTAIGLAAAYIVPMLTGFLFSGRQQPRVDRAAGNLMLATGSVGLCLIAAEILLWLLASPVTGRTALLDLVFPPAQAEILPGHVPADLLHEMLPPALLDAAARRQQVLAIPAEWRMRDAPVSPETAGAERAIYWQGVLQVYNADRMRYPGAIPPKTKDAFRVLVLGDSFTYGSGVEDRHTYPRQLEALLRRHYKVDVVNAGVEGAQSEDIVRIARRLLPHVRPDLVVYGMCENDFLPSAVAQYDGSVKLPRLISEHTRLGSFAEAALSQALIALGLRRDFYDDILAGAHDYQHRFARDMEALQALVTGAGLAPVVAMVLDQFPDAGGRGQQIAKLAEGIMDRAGMAVVSTDRYYTAYSGRSLWVSRWEGHPNEEAHALFAAMLFPAVVRQPGLLEHEE